MKNRMINTVVFTLLFALAVSALSSCDIVRLKYPGEREVGAEFREEDVDFVIKTDPKSPDFARGIITKENGELLDLLIKWGKNSRFYAYDFNTYKKDVSETLVEGKYYASGKLYGTGTFELEITSWSIDPPFEKKELLFAQVKDETE